MNREAMQCLDLLAELILNHSTISAPRANLRKRGEFEGFVYGVETAHMAFLGAIVSIKDALARSDSIDDIRRLLIDGKPSVDREPGEEGRQDQQRPLIQDRQGHDGGGYIDRRASRNGPSDVQPDGTDPGRPDPNPVG